MKLNWQMLITWILASILFACFLIGSVGCDSVKQQQKGWNKFVKYGGRIDCDKDTVTYNDTTWIEGKPVVKEVKIPCDCPEPVVGYTNKQIRMMLRHQKDSMSYIIKLEKIRAQKMEDSLKGLLKLSKQETKQDKQETKQVQAVEKTKKSENNKWKIWLAMIIIALIAIFMIKKL